MGAWGQDIFDNDDAADLVGEVLDTPTNQVANLLDATLAAVIDPEDPYLEVGCIARGIAAVAVLVAARDGSSLTTVAHEDELWVHLAATGVGVAGARAEQARAVLDRALDPEDNEWWELWDDADDLAGATAPVRRLRDLV